MGIVLVGLNEINFDYVGRYVAKGELPTLARLMDSQRMVTTQSEERYELLEPWIQWVTIQTGLSYSEHQVFRLGDIVDRPDLTQIFEVLEANGHSVGAVSPFNAANRLNDAAFFFPDPWTQTPVTASGPEEWAFKQLAKMVNNNAHGGPDLQALLACVAIVARHNLVSPKRLLDYGRVARSIRLPGMQAVALDMLLSDIFVSHLRRTMPDFSLLFLNSGAHLQHHYLFNSGVYEGDLENPEWYCTPDHDPLLEMLREYDKSLQRIADLPGTEVFVATGLRQVPHNRETYYWRPKDHDNFAKLLGAKGFKSIVPRMSRDFLVQFDNATQAAEAEQVFTKCLVDDKPLLSVDNRGLSLFVEVIYDESLESPRSVVSPEGDTLIANVKDHVSFVAIKNGRHDQTGYFGYLGPEQQYFDGSTIDLTEVYGHLHDRIVEHAG